MNKYSPYLYLPDYDKKVLESKEAGQRAEKYRTRVMRNHKCPFMKYHNGTRCIMTGLNNKMN